MEIGILQQFLQTPHELYGHLATKTLMKQIWKETETNGLLLQSADKIAWTPQLQGNSDHAIMDIAMKVYFKKMSSKINRCRLYLQVITLYDIVTYDGVQIHPNILMGIRPPSRQTIHHWVNFPKPPKKDMILWQEFVLRYLQPLIIN
jgi:hypothetical protein